MFLTGPLSRFVVDNELDPWLASLNHLWQLNHYFLIYVYFEFIIKNLFEAVKIFFFCVRSKPRRYLKIDVITERPCNCPVFSGSLVPGRVNVGNRSFKLKDLFDKLRRLFPFCFVNLSNSMFDCYMMKNLFTISSLEVNLS